MRALIYTNSEQEYQLLRKIAEEEIDGIIVSQIRMDGHFHVEEDSDIAVIARRYGHGDHADLPEQTSRL